MAPILVLEWDYTPADYFEEPIEAACHDYTMKIANGQARAEVDPGLLEADPKLRQRIHDALNDRFLGVQLLSHRAYDLSKSKRTIVHSDGRRDLFIEPNPVVIEVSGGRLDVQVKDGGGNITFDSRAERIAKHRSLAKQIALHRSTDRVLASLLASQSKGVRDPENELVYLYEIRDALCSRFGGEASARDQLGVSREAWSRFGRLCNDEPLRQGRHRGKATGDLRHATEAELAEARRIAREMIEAYMRYLGDAEGE